MKITAQRSLLWIVNFTIVAALIGFVILMGKNNPRNRGIDLANAKSELANRMKEVRPPTPDQDARGTGEQKLATLFDRNFHYAGYVPPPKPEVKEAEKGPRQAPPLESLIKVIWVVAPIREEPGGPLDMESAGASVTIKSLPVNSNTFWYREGEVIGIGDDKRKDVDQTLKQFGGARIVRVEPDGLVCEWGGRPEEKVVIGLRDTPGGFAVTQNGKTLVGDISKKSVGGSGGGDYAGRLAEVSPGPGQLDKVDITSEGYDTINARGEELIQDVAFDTGDDGKGGKALQIKSLPADLQSYGLQDGDTIIKIDATPVTSKETIVRYVRATHRRKKSYNVTILRDGAQRTLRITVPQDPSRLRRPGGNIKFGERNADRRRR